MSLLLLGWLSAVACGISVNPDKRLQATIEAEKAAVARTVAAENEALNATSTARAITQTPTSSLRAEGTPPGTKPGWKVFISAAHPYSISYPPNWTAEPGALKTESGAADLFVIEATGASFTPTVNVLSVPGQPGIRDSQSFMASILARLLGQNVNPQRKGALTVDGVQAFILSYLSPSLGPNVTATQVVFFENDRGWVITLTSQTRDVSQYEPTLLEVASTFQAR